MFANLAIFYLLVTQIEPIFSVLTSRNSTEIMKLALNNHTSILCLCMLFAMASKVRKKGKNFKINLESGRIKKKITKSRSSALSKDLAGLNLYTVNNEIDQS